MSEIYYPREYERTFIVIEEQAAEHADDVFVKTLRMTSSLRVTGQRIIQRDRYTINAVTGRHELNENRPYKLGVVNDEVPQMVSSLRWHEADDALPTGLEEGFPYLCVYELPYDRYIEAIALSSFGFEACTADGETLRT